MFLIAGEALLQNLAAILLPLWEKVAGGAGRMRGALVGHFHDFTHRDFGRAYHEVILQSQNKKALTTKPTFFAFIAPLLFIRVV